MKIFRFIKTISLTVACVTTIGISALAGSWQWIDTNGDGLAACYYFNDDGTLQSGGTTPDGYTINQSGAWVVDGVIQQRSVLTDKAHENISFSGTTDISSPYNGYYRFKNASSMGMTMPFSGVDIVTLAVNIDTNGYLNLAIAYDDGQSGTITLPKNDYGTYTMSTTGGDVIIAFSEGQMTWSGAYYGIPTVLSAEKVG